MKKTADITLQYNTLIIEGDLNFSNVMLVFQKSLRILPKNKNLTFDFSQLQSSDSSAIALIIEWIKFANSHNKSIRFTNLSDELISIAKAAHLDKLIV